MLPTPLLVRFVGLGRDSTFLVVELEDSIETDVSGVVEAGRVKTLDRIATGEFLTGAFVVLLTDKDR